MKYNIAIKATEKIMKEIIETVTASSEGGASMGGNIALYIILGVIMMLMALQIWGIISIAPSTYLAAKNTRRGYPGALIAGIIGGIFSSPCSTPVLIALIAMTAASESMVRGAVLMLLYAAGCSALSVILGSSPSLIRKLGQKKEMRIISRILTFLLGLAVLIIGAVLLYLGF